MEPIVIARLIEADRSAQCRTPHADYRRHNVYAREAAERSRSRRAAWNRMRSGLAAVMYKIARALEPRPSVEASEVRRRPV